MRRARIQPNTSDSRAFLRGISSLRRRLDAFPRRPWLTLALLVLTGLVYTAFSLSLSGWNEVRWNGTTALFLLNLLPALLSLLVLWLAFGQAWLSALAVGTLCFLITAGNYFKLQFRDTPLEWADLYHIREGFGMSEQYKVTFTPAMWQWIASIVVLAALLFCLGRGVPGAVVRLLSLTGAGLALLICFYNIYPGSELYADMSAGKGGSKTESYVACGVLYPFLHSAGEYMGTSWAYNEAEAERIMKQVQDAEIPPERRVNLIGIQMEAFADFTRFPVEGMDENIYTAFHDLQARSYTGTLITDIFAGGTTETEWAVLTGGNRHDDFKVKTDSVAWYLKNQGYLCNGSHPCRDWFYDRKHVNPNLGFEDYLYTDNYYYQFIKPGADVAFDDIFFPDLMERLDPQLAAEQSLFSFNVTYQGHGPYETEFCYWGSDFCDGPYSQECLNALNNYFWIVQNTGENLSAFVDWLAGRPEPVVLFLYSDHMPWMGDGARFYQELGIDLDVSTEEGFRNYYSTWYLFWANDAAKDMIGWDFTGRGPDLSPCFLMDHLFRKLGWEGSDYMQAQRTVADAVPVLHTTGWNQEAGGQLTPEVSAQVRNFQIRFQTLSTWDRHRYAKEGTISPADTPSE